MRFEFSDLRVGCGCDSICLYSPGDLSVWVGFRVTWRFSVMRLRLLRFVWLSTICVDCVI